MKTNKFKILIAGVIVVMMTGFAISQEGGPRHHGEFGALGFFTKALNLTDAQQTQIKQIITNEKPTLHPLMQQEGQAHQQMMQLVTGGNFDETKAQAIIAQESQTHAQIELEHARIMSQAYQLLTPDQKAKFAQMQARHQQRMTQHTQEEQPAPNQ